jgi:hypothetical protein
MVVELIRNEAPANPAKSVPAPLLTNQANPIGRVHDNAVWFGPTTLDPRHRKLLHKLVEAVLCERAAWEAEGSKKGD